MWYLVLVVSSPSKISTTRQFEQKSFFWSKIEHQPNILYTCTKTFLQLPTIHFLGMRWTIRFFAIGQSSLFECDCILAIIFHHSTLILYRKLGSHHLLDVVLSWSGQAVEMSGHSSRSLSLAQVSLSSNGGSGRTSCLLMQTHRTLVSGDSSEQVTDWEGTSILFFAQVQRVKGHI